MKKIKNGDEVVVTTGKDKGRRGNVREVRADGKILVDGVNIVKRHTKGNPMAGVAGGIVEKEAAIDISNVMLWNASAEKGDRVGFKVQDGKKVRFFKSNDQLVDS